MITQQNTNQSVPTYCLSWFYLSGGDALHNLKRFSIPQYRCSDYATRYSYFEYMNKPLTEMVHEMQHN